MPDNSHKALGENFINTFAQELLSAIHPERVIAHYEKQFDKIVADRCIEELKRPLTLHVDSDTSESYREGFNEAIRQSNLADEERISELSKEQEGL